LSDNTREEKLFAVYVQFGNYVEQFVLLLLLDAEYDRLDEATKTAAAQLLSSAGQISMWNNQKEKENEN
jgi:hypothetical protein